jgi:hypothetical protein
VTDRTGRPRAATYGQTKPGTETAMSTKIKRAFSRYLETQTAAYEPIAQSYRR